jgi:hypothetical protein
MRQKHVACYAGSALASLSTGRQAAPLHLVPCSGSTIAEDEQPALADCHRVRCRCKGLKLELRLQGYRHNSYQTPLSTVLSGSTSG